MVMRPARGFTLTEIVIVLAVMAVLAASGAPALSDFLSNQRVKTASFDLFSTLVHARSEAITRNAAVTVAPVSSSWTSGWTVTSGGTTIRTMGAVPNVEITGPTSVVFRGSGRLTAVIIPFELSGGGWSSVTTRCISVDLSGRAISKATACL